MDEIDRHRCNRQPVERRVGAADGMIDQQRLLGFRHPVVLRADINRLAARPGRRTARCGRVKLKHQGLRVSDAVGREQNATRADTGIVRRRQCCRNRDQRNRRTGRRRGRQCQRVARNIGPCGPARHNPHPRRHRRKRHHVLGLVGDRHRNALREGIVVGRIRAGDALVDHRALTIRKLADHRRDHVARDVEHIIAGTADQGCDTARRCAQHGDRVIAALAVDCQHLRVLQSQRQTSTTDGGRCDHHHVIRPRAIGAQHAQRVGSPRAIDRQRGLDHVRIARRRLAETAEGETVVPRSSDQGERRLAVEHRKTVGPAAGIDRRGIAVAAAEITRRRLHRGDRIAALHHGSGHGTGAVELTELEAVAPRPAIDRGDGAVVVDIEGIIARAARHLQQVDRTVVIDPLVAGGIGAGAALQHGDEVRAHQIPGGHGRSRDAERIRAIRRGPAVMDGHDRIARTGRRDDIGIGPCPAIDVDDVAQRAGFKPRHDAGRAAGTRDILVSDVYTIDIADGDTVFSAPAPQVHLPRDHRRDAQCGHRTESDDIVPGRAVDIALFRRQRSVEEDLVGQRPAADRDRPRCGRAGGETSEPCRKGCDRPGIGAENPAGAVDDDPVGPIARRQAHHRGLHDTRDVDRVAGRRENRRPRRWVAEIVALVIRLDHQRRPGLHHRAGLQCEVVPGQKVGRARHLHHQRPTERVERIDHEIARPIRRAADRPVLRDQQQVAAHIDTGRHLDRA